MTMRVITTTRRDVFIPELWLEVGIEKELDWVTIDVDKVSVAAVVSTDVMIGTAGNAVVKDPLLMDMVGIIGVMVVGIIGAMVVGIIGASDVVLVILTTRLERGRRVAIVSWYFVPRLRLAVATPPALKKEIPRNQLQNRY